MPYASVEELRFVLQIEQATQLQMAAMKRALDEAAQEIDWELGYTEDAPAPDPPPALVAGVCLDRAVEHYKQSYVPWGVMPTSGDQSPIVAARDSWYRHARKLQSMKLHEGIA